MSEPLVNVDRETPMLLPVAHEMGLLKVGKVRVEATHITANASRQKGLQREARVRLRLPRLQSWASLF